jgi:uncharacterized protein YqhQ
MARPGILQWTACFIGALSASGDSQKNRKVGGQAIIEGVMMRGRSMISWAVRRPSGEVAIESSPFTSIAKKYPILKKPILRGALSLYESLVIGMKALTRSAEIAAEEESKGEADAGIKQKIGNAASMILAVLISFGLFVYLPLKSLSFVVPEESAFAYNLLAGMVRVGIFLLYLFGISLWKDVRRLFEYHGAEHKAIFAFEDGHELTLDKMKPYKTYHPRCGTSFLILVALVCVFIFGIIDSVIIHFMGPYPNVFARTLTHIAFIPLVSGMSFEVLRLSDKYRHVPVVRALIQPGLWLQRITTKEPDDHQMNVAVSALKAVI